MPTLNQSRKEIQISFTQGAAGSLDLVTAPGAELYVHVTALVVSLSAAGTLKFQENGATDLTGPITLATGVPLELAAGSGQPILSTKTANLKLNLVSVTGAASGWMRYYLSPEK